MGIPSMIDRRQVMGVYVTEAQCPKCGAKHPLASFHLAALVDGKPCPHLRTCPDCACRVATAELHAVTFTPRMTSTRRRHIPGRARHEVEHPTPGFRFSHNDEHPA